MNKFQLKKLKFIFLVTVANCAEIMLETFSNPKHAWVQKNDPVMGGKSTGTFTIENDVGIMDGYVAIIPFLLIFPGFIKVETTEEDAPWPDVSTCTHLKMNVMSSNDYSGYRVSFGKNKPPNSFVHVSGYKADFFPPVGEFGDVEIPFTDFSYDWNAATGNQITTCYENPDNCPDEATLKDLYEISIWGEGVKGDVHLEVRSISATGCAEV